MKWSEHLSKVKVSTRATQFSLSTIVLIVIIVCASVLFPSIDYFWMKTKWKWIEMFFDWNVLPFVGFFFLLENRKVNPDTLKMTPRCLLVGHTAPVLCLSRASIVLDNNFLVSSSENGEMCTWDLVDGKCKENVKLPQVHTSIQVMWCDKPQIRTDSLFINARVHFIFVVRLIICPIVMIFGSFAMATTPKFLSWIHSVWKSYFR